MATVLASVAVGRGEISVVLGDLTEERVDAIVNPANTALAHGGGVAGAIVRLVSIDEETASHFLAAVRRPC